MSHSPVIKLTSLVMVMLIMSTQMITQMDLHQEVPQVSFFSMIL